MFFLTVRVEYRANIFWYSKIVMTDLLTVLRCVRADAPWCLKQSAVLDETLHLKFSHSGRKTTKNNTNRSPAVQRYRFQVAARETPGSRRINTLKMP